mmetsp:Transcript_64385/g.188379  ORF Transcript_64385/g.188379 Transcript_64385/m.188379 type:complete len:226 (+) Transcript_64385:398-1075(+)
MDLRLVDEGAEERGESLHSAHDLFIRLATAMPEKATEEAAGGLYAAKLRLCEVFGYIFHGLLNICRSIVHQRSTLLLEGIHLILAPGLLRWLLVRSCTCLLRRAFRSFLPCLRLKLLLLLGPLLAILFGLGFFLFLLAFPLLLLACLCLALLLLSLFFVHCLTLAWRDVCRLTAAGRRLPLCVPAAAYLAIVLPRPPGGVIVLPPLLLPSGLFLLLLVFLQSLPH